MALAALPAAGGSRSAQQREQGDGTENFAAGAAASLADWSLKSQVARQPGTVENIAEDASSAHPVGHVHRV